MLLPILYFALKPVIPAVTQILTVAEVAKEIILHQERASPDTGRSSSPPVNVISCVVQWCSFTQQVNEVFIHPVTAQKIDLVSQKNKEKLFCGVMCM